MPFHRSTLNLLFFVAATAFNETVLTFYRPYSLDFYHATFGFTFTLSYLLLHFDIRSAPGLFVYSVSPALVLFSLLLPSPEITPHVTNGLQSVQPIDGIMAFPITLAAFAQGLTVTYALNSSFELLERSIPHLRHWLKRYPHNRKLARCLALLRLGRLRRHKEAQAQKSFKG